LSSPPPEGIDAFRLSICGQPKIKEQFQGQQSQPRQKAADDSLQRRKVAGVQFARTYRICLAAATARTGHNGHRQNLKTGRSFSLKMATQPAPQDEIIGLIIAVIVS
jgi:hypothetical protein